MSQHASQDIDAAVRVAAGFALPGPVRAAAHHATGWIHATWVLTCDAPAGPVRFVLQRVNRHVFHRPEEVMENVARVTAHQHAVLRREGASDPERRALALVPARDGRVFAVDDAGELWRTYRFVEGAQSHDVARSPAHARAAAQAFGRFVAQLADLPGPRLHDTIPGFHDARPRLEALREAARRDVRGRLRDARAEVDAMLARAEIAERLPSLVAAGVLPERVTHNDTKINNVLVDDASGEGLCVIDLDTVMTGLVAYDFGDLVRTAACPAREDERDLARVRVNPVLFGALAEGFLRGAGPLLTVAEREELAFGGLHMTYAVGMRFLIDHLEGDRYFRVERPGQNLDRARAQLALLRSLEGERDRLREIVERAAPKAR